MEPTQTIAIATIPQAISTLYQAVCLAQKAGVYSLQDANQISLALNALRYRLHLDQNMKPIVSGKPESLTRPTQDQALSATEVKSESNPPPNPPPLPKSD